MRGEDVYLSNVFTELNFNIFQSFKVNFKAEVGKFLNSVSVPEKNNVTLFRRKA